MKSITKLVVVAMLLVAALVVAPATAARTIGDGGNAYVGEKHVDLATVFAAAAGDSGTLVYYSSVATPEAATIGKTITVNDVGDFELTASDFTSTGAWYAFNAATVAGGAKLTNQSAADGYILVEKPSVSLDVKLAGTTDSVDGKSVTRNSDIQFEIKHNIRVPAVAVTDLDNGLFMKIEVTTPDGGILTSLDNVPLGTRLLSGTKNTTASISLKDLKPGTYTAIAKWGNTSALDSSNSNSVTFDVATKALTITSNKDSVVRNNNFVVTITGESKENYWVYVKDAAIGSGEYPLILRSQPGVNTTIEVDSYDIPTGIIGKQSKLPSSYAKGPWVNSSDPDDVREGPALRTIAVVDTKADGTRTIEFETDKFTKDRQFTIRVQEVDDPSKYDEVRVRVEKGSVTVTASGTGVYYIGEEIMLSGTNTDSRDIYLFMTGPNLATNGVNLTALGAARTGLAGTFTDESVEADDTWSYRWNTAGFADADVSLDAGGYTVYAVSEAMNKEHLSDAEYATVSVHLKTGFLTAATSGTTIAKGNDLKITGTAMGDPDNIFVWIFGKNKQILGVSATVESDGSFEYELKGGATKEWSAGQYFVVVQHPMMDGNQGIYAKNGVLHGIAGSGVAKEGINIGRLQASDAANALIQALNSPNIDDTYVKLTFNVDEAYIAIDPIGTKESGSKFTISGTTNVAVGDKLIVDVTSAAFGPTDKTEAAGFGAVSGTAIVEKGDGMNTWSFEVDASELKPDEYIVTVESIEADKTATATFNMVEATETPPAEVTTAPEGEVTTAPPEGETTTAEPTTPPTPGFGALVALAGLGAVAFLVLRRK